jgi:hypothetical protein
MDYPLLGIDIILLLIALKSELCFLTMILSTRTLNLIETTCQKHRQQAFISVIVLGKFLFLLLGNCCLMPIMISVFAKTTYSVSTVEKMPLQRKVC